MTKLLCKLFIKNGDIVKVIAESEKNVNLDAQVNKYLNNVIPEEEIAYKTISTFKKSRTSIYQKLP